MNKSGLKITGKYKVEVRRRDANGVQQLIRTIELLNAATLEGLDALLDIMFHGVSAKATWFLGLIDADALYYTGISEDDTHASHDGWIENIDYDETDRIEWEEDAAVDGVISNTTVAVFTMSGTCAIKNIFCASLSTKESVSGSGVLWSTALFVADQNLEDGDTLSITYTVEAANV